MDSDMLPNILPIKEKFFFFYSSSSIKTTGVTFLMIFDREFYFILGSQKSFIFCIKNLNGCYKTKLRSPYSGLGFIDCKKGNKTKNLTESIG